MSGRISHTRLADGSEIFRILENASFKEDLGIVDLQIGELEKLTDEFKRTVQDHAYSANRVPELSHDLEQNVAAIRRKFDQLLTEEQQERLKQLLVRREINKSSLLRELTVGKLAKSLKLSQSVNSKLKNVRQSEAERLNKECKDLKDEFVERILGVLTTSQDEELSHFSQEFESVPVFAPLDFMVAQCKSLDSESGENETDLPDELSEFEFLVTKTSYEIDDAGQFVEVAKPQKTYQLALFAYSGLQREIGNSSSESEHSVLEYQKETCQELDKQFSELTDSLLVERTRLKSQGNWSSERQQEYNQEISEFCLDAIEKIRQTLIPQQLESIRMRGERMTVLQRGLPYSLMHGSLGERLKITEEQKESLEAICDQIVNEYNRFSKSQERDHTQRVFSVLPKDAQEELERILGDPIESESFAIGVLARRLGTIGSSDLK